MRALSACPDIQLALLFGALAESAGRNDSDLDLAVDAGRHLTTQVKVVLISELAHATGRPIDLVDIRAIGGPLLDQIVQHGKKILGTDERYAELIRRHLFDAADFLPYRDRILTERRRAWIGK